VSRLVGSEMCIRDSLKTEKTISTESTRNVVYTVIGD
jgi:hypothetical protein